MKDELEEMKSLIEGALRDGAFGMSTGLVYPPSCYGDTEELIELAGVVARYGGIYATHVRGERETYLEAIKEAIRIGEEAGLPVQLSHCAPKYGSWGKSEYALKLVEDARRRGVDVTIDNDAETCFSGSLRDLLPPKYQCLSKEELFELIRSREGREKIKEEIINEKIPGFGPLGLLKHGKWENVVVHKCELKELEGKDLKRIAEEMKRDPFDVFFDLLEKEIECSLIFRDYVWRRDVETLLSHPLVMLSSDSVANSRRGPLSELLSSDYSPWDFGEFVKILASYVRDLGFLRLEEAIRKLTSFPAQRLNLMDRGLIREGMWADIVVFDLKKLRERAFDRFPHEPPEGVELVLVNGEISVRSGEYTGALAGRVLRHGNGGEMG